MNELISEILEKQKLIKVLSDELELLKEKLLFEMEESNVDKYEYNGNWATISKSASQLRLDKSLVQRKLSPEDFEQCFKEVSVKSFVKVISAESALKMKEFTKK
jgi:hypothetical protein